VGALPDGNLCGYLRDCCDLASGSLPPGHAKDTVTAVRSRLEAGLLRVAVGGRLNAGKSTLVNALLGEKLADTNATECTKLVSRFTYGLMNQVVIWFTDGATFTCAAQPLASAVASAGRPVGDVDFIEVRSSNKRLATEYTLVDTPGLDTLTDGLDDMSLAALGEADVLLYVMPHPGDNDVEALTALRRKAGGAGITALSTIGVLSRIDQLGQGAGDPWPVARRQAERYADQLTALFGTVIPVLGLLAETALGDRFTESDLAPLRALLELRATDPEAVEFALYSAEDFKQEPRLPLTGAERTRLLDLLGNHGVSVALDVLDGGVRSATALLAALRAHSGIDALTSQLSRQFAGLADPLRARSAVQALDAVSWLGASPQETAVLARLREDLDAVRDHPRLRQFGLMTVLADLEAGRWQGPTGTAAELAAFATGTDLTAQLGLAADASTAQVRARLVDRVTAWRVLENSATSSRATSRRAREVREYLESLFDTLPPPG